MYTGVSVLGFSLFSVVFLLRGSPPFIGAGSYKYNPMRSLWTTTCPWAIRLGLFQDTHLFVGGEVSSCQDSMSIASFHSLVFVFCGILG